MNRSCLGAALHPSWSMMLDDVQKEGLGRELGMPQLQRMLGDYGQIPAQSAPFGAMLHAAYAGVDDARRAAWRCRRDGYFAVKASERLNAAAVVDRIQRSVPRLRGLQLVRADGLYLSLNRVLVPVESLCGGHEVEVADLVDAANILMARLGATRLVPLRGPRDVEAYAARTWGSTCRLSDAGLINATSGEMALTFGVHARPVQA